MMLLIVAATIIIVIITYYLHHKWTYWKRCGAPNDVLSMLGVLNLPFHEMDRRSVAKCGKVVGIYEFLNPALLVADADVAKQVLVTDFHNFAHRKVLQRKSDYFSASLFASRDEEWKRLRQSLTPSFSSGKLKRMQSLMEESVTSLIEMMSEQVATGGKNGKNIEIIHLISAFSMDVILSCAFGTRVDTVKNPDSKVAVQGRKFLARDIPWQTMLVIAFPEFSTEVLKLNAIPKGPSRFFANLTAQVVNERKANPDYVRSDFIHFCMQAETEDGGSLTTKEIADNGIAFFIAGFDTSSHTLIYATYLMALYPEVQEKLHEEVDKYFERSSEVTYDRLKELTYMDAVISETLRMMIPVPRTMRVASQDCHLGNISVAKGTTVWISNYCIHNDPDYFETPEKFIPERFLPGNGGLRHNSNAYIPFALGPRNCIGMRFAQFEIKLCLLQMMKKFRFERCDQTRVPLEYFAGQVVMGAKDVTLKVIAR